MLRKDTRPATIFPPIFSALLAAISLVCLPSVTKAGSDRDPTGAERPVIEDLAFMAGHWSGEAFGGTFEEVYLPPVHGTITGVMRLMDENGVRDQELISIAETPDGIVYSVALPQGPVSEGKAPERHSFALRHVDDQGAYFEGLSFVRTGTDEMTVTLEVRDETGAVKDMVMTYVRTPPVTCPPQEETPDL